MFNKRLSSGFVQCVGEETAKRAAACPFPAAICSSAPTSGGRPVAVPCVPGAAMPLHRFPPRLWPALRLRQGLCSRLPAHCLRALQEDEAPAAPVHWRPQGARYRRDPRSGERQRLQDVPVLPFLPPAAHRGLWGGEGWIRGFRYARNDKVRPVPPSSYPSVPPRARCPRR